MLGALSWYIWWERNRKLKQHTLRPKEIISKIVLTSTQIRFSFFMSIAANIWAIYQIVVGLILLLKMDKPNLEIFANVIDFYYYW